MSRTGPAATRSPPVALAQCSIARAIDLVGDRWTLLILRAALYGVTRFEEFLNDLGCPRSVLAGRLRRLEALGLMTRTAYRTAGQRQRYAYTLTPPARALALPLLALMQWMDSQTAPGLAAGLAPSRPPVRVQARDGRELQVALIDPQGAVVTLDQIRMTLSVAATTQ